MENQSVKMILVSYDGVEFQKGSMFLWAYKILQAEVQMLFNLFLVSFSKLRFSAIYIEPLFQSPIPIARSHFFRRVLQRGCEA